MSVCVRVRAQLCVHVHTHIPLPSVGGNQNCLTFNHKLPTADRDSPLVQAIGGLYLGTGGFKFDSQCCCEVLRSQEMHLSDSCGVLGGRGWIRVLSGKY